MGGNDQIQEIIRRENWQDLVRIVLDLGGEREERLMMTEWMVREFSFFFLFFNIYLLGCSGSSLWLSGSLLPHVGSLVEACGI